MSDRHGCLDAPSRMLMVRHAPSTWNEHSRWQGWADPPLADGWRGLVVAAAAGIPNCITGIASSDLARARDTARLIADQLGIGQVLARERLREQHAGLWTGLTKSEIKQRWPEELRTRPRQPVGGESGDEVVDRVIGELAELVDKAGPAKQDDSGHCLLVVTHSAVIRNLEAHLGVFRQPAPSVGHLQGRWFGVWPDGRLVAGDSTAGRVPAEVGV